MFDIKLLYPQKQSGAFKGYGFAGDIVKDLNLSVILKEMAGKDEYMYTSCKHVLMNPIQDEAVLCFRQRMVNDAISNIDYYEGLYRIGSQVVGEIEKRQRKNQDSSKIQQIYNSLEVLMIDIEYLERLKGYIRTEAAERSDGMAAFAAKVREVYSDEFIADLREELEHVTELLKGGRLVLTAGIGGGMKCADAVINRIELVDYRQMGRIRRVLRQIVLRFFSPESIRLTDVIMHQEASQMETNSLHYMLQFFLKLHMEFQEFFNQLRSQTSFYVGCANLYRKLNNCCMPVSFPVISISEKLDYQNLYEVSMALTTLKMPVSNTLSDDCHLHLISGANQGGKSTFLRSVGIAQVMMQAGLFVPATFFESRLYDTIVTHFTRREDSSMNSGRMVEEMKRMNYIVDRISSHSLILMNESFSSTTEKEGSLIAESIIQAMYDSGVNVWMVTHLFAFAKGMYGKELGRARFLSAERKEDGTRTYKMIEREPKETSYGLDLYRELIGEV